MRHRFLIFVAALASAPSAAAAQTIRIDVLYAVASDFLPAFVAKDKGFFGRHKLDVTLTRVLSASTVPAVLVSGSAQIGMSTAPNLLQAKDGGIDLVIVAGSTRVTKANQTVSLVARTGVSVFSAADLKGKKVGVPGFNSLIDVVLRKWLLNHQVPAQSVNLIEAPIPQMNDMLKAGVLDAVAVIEPMRSRITAAGNGVIAADFYSEVNPDTVGAFWVATADWAGRNAETIAGFRAALAEGVRFIDADQGAAREIEAKYLGIVAPKLPTYQAVVTPADLDFFATVGKEIGQLRRPIDSATLILR